MSFSFNVRVASLDLVAAAVAAELSKIAAAHPIHTLDADAVQKAAEAHAALLPADADSDVGVAVTGWIEYQGDEAAPKVVAAHVNITARLLEREPVAETPVAAE